MKKLAIGVDDFKEIIKENFYYIDKTKFIILKMQKKTENYLIIYI